MNVMHNENYSEQELIDGARRGEQEAMKRIYLLHARYLTAVCSRYVVNPEDVRDTLQDSFVAIFGNIDKYRPKENASLRSWMTRIVVNNSLQFLRKSEKMQFIESVDEYADVVEETAETDGIRAEKPQGDSPHSRNKRRHIGFAIPQGEEDACSENKPI